MFRFLKKLHRYNFRTITRINFLRSKKVSLVIMSSGILLSVARYFHQPEPDYSNYQFDSELRSIYLRYNPWLFLLLVTAPNLAIFGLWKISPFSARLSRFLRRNFTLRPELHRLSRRPHTLFTHFFSHSSALHLLANLFCLTSFTFGLYQAIGAADFLNLYIGGGLAGAALHVIFSLFSKATLAPAAGLSAAALSIFAASVLFLPHSKVSVFFLPFWSFEAWQALEAIILLDLVGLLLGWTFFAHAGHLGGTLYGVIMFYYLSRVRGTRKDGACLLNMNVYKGPLKEYKPIGSGRIFLPDESIIKGRFWLDLLSSPPEAQKIGFSYASDLEIGNK